MAHTGTLILSSGFSVMSDFHRLRFRRLPTLPVSRRGFLKRLGGASLGALAAGATPGCSNSTAPAGSGGAVDANSVAFLHGVASGDPMSDRVILWTRVTPGGEQSGPLRVDWRLSADPQMDAEIVSGQFVTGADRDFTVKVDPSGLDSFTTYYYQFSVTLNDGSVVRSPIGRTRTAPGAGDDLSQVRIASAACNSYSFGYFNAFGRVGERADLDLFIHLGDYIYEGGGGQVRTHAPDREITTLADYRQRHAQYKTDPDLQEAHRQHPWLMTIDDHETTNNSYSTGASNHTEGHPDDGGEGFWGERVGWALRAYYEWMPVRDRGDGFDAPAAGQDRTEAGQTGLSPNGLGRIYRRVPYGEQIDIFLLDTRLAGRVEENTDFINDEAQTILGAEQRQWFLDALAASTATWKLICNGTTFAPLIAGASNPLTGCTTVMPATDPCYVNQDAWDGYRFDRDAVYDVIENNGVENCVFLFGDIHAVIACDLPRDPNDLASYNPATGEGSLGVEFCCGGVAQLPVPVWTGLLANGFNPHMKHAQETRLGYMLLDITPQRSQAEWYYATVQQPNTLETPDPVMLQTTLGSQRLTTAVQRSSGSATPPPLAP